jgi:hypothetical protein
MADSTFYLVLVVVRKVTDKGAELVRQHVINPYHTTFFLTLVSLLKNERRNLALNLICDMSGTPNSYVPPDHKFERRDISNDELITMAHLLCFNGQIADALREMNDLRSPNNIDADSIIKGANLLSALYEFDNSLSAILDALTAKSNFLHIPAVIPFGKSELDMLEEARKKS